MKLRSLIVSSLIGLSLAACNAGSTLPSSTTTTQATVTQSYSNQAVTAGTPFSLPAAGGVTPAITSSSGLTFSGSVTDSTSLPANVGTFSLAGPVLQDLRTSKSTVANSTAIVYSSFTPTTSLTLTGTFGFTAQLASSSVPSGYNYYLAFYNGSSWDATDFPNAATVTTSGTTSTITFSALTLPSAGLTLSAGTTYAAALYALPSNVLNGTLTSAQQVFGTFTDGTTASLTLPTISGATGKYQVFGSAAYLPSGLQAPTSGTFIGGATTTASSGFTVPSGTAFPYVLTPSSTAVGKTITLYLLSATAGPTSLKAVPVTSTSNITGSITTPAAYTLTAGQSYTFAAYEQ